MSQVQPERRQARPIEPEPELEPKVLGESKYDQVTSFLMAVVLGAILVVGWLALVYASNQAYASRVTAPLQIIEVFGGGGGSPEGTPGSTEKIDVAGADAAAMASNNEEEAGDFEEPSVQQTPGAMLDAVAEAGQSLAEVDLGAVMPSGGAGRQRQARVQARDRRARAGLRAGRRRRRPPNSAGASSTSTGQTADEYARQLDALGCRAGRGRPAPTSSCTSRISRARRRPSGMAPGAATTGSISSGKGGAERHPTSRFCKKAGVEVGDENRLPVLSRRGRASGSPSSRSATRDDSPARSASRASGSCPRATATISRSSRRKRSGDRRLSTVDGR